MFAFFFFLLIEDDWKKEYVPVPIPVPVYVPVPMNMYSQNVPVPTTVPVPVSQTSFMFKLASIHMHARDHFVLLTVIILLHLNDCRILLRYLLNWDQKSGKWHVISRLFFRTHLPACVKILHC